VACRNVCRASDRTTRPRGTGGPSAAFVNPCEIGGLKASGYHPLPPTTYHLPPSSVHPRNAPRP
jgi:hypothetical protein